MNQHTAYFIFRGGLVLGTADIEGRGHIHIQVQGGVWSRKSQVTSRASRNTLSAESESESESESQLQLQLQLQLPLSLSIAIVNCRL